MASRLRARAVSSALRAALRDGSVSASAAYSNHRRVKDKGRSEWLAVVCGVLLI